jgi:hypothetical protein
LNIEQDVLTVNGVKYVREDSQASYEKGHEVIIRTYSAGVHVGNLDEEWIRADQIVTLKNARRIWRWRGANTLNEIATNGVTRSEYTRISDPVEKIKLNPIEIIPVKSGVDLSKVWNV